jgi:hypothetical protein
MRAEGRPSASVATLPALAPGSPGLGHPARPFQARLRRITLLGCCSLPDWSKLVSNEIIVIKQIMELSENQLRPMDYWLKLALRLIPGCEARSDGTSGPKRKIRMGGKHA